MQGSSNIAWLWTCRFPRVGVCLRSGHRQRADPVTFPRPAPPPPLALSRCGSKWTGEIRGRQRRAQQTGKGEEREAGEARPREWQPASVHWRQSTASKVTDGVHTQSRRVGASLSRAIDSVDCVACVYSAGPTGRGARAGGHAGSDAGAAGRAVEGGGQQLLTDPQKDRLKPAFRP